MKDKLNLFDQYGVHGKTKFVKSEETEPDFRFIEYEKLEEDKDIDVGPDDRKTFIHQVIGEKGLLNREHCRRASRAFKKIRRKTKHAYLMISVMGYDSDPREVFDIPEVADYYRQFARLTGLDDLEKAQALLAEESVRVLRSCQVYGPVNVRVQTDMEEVYKMQERSLHNWLRRLPKDN